MQLNAQPCNYSNHPPSRVHTIRKYKPHKFKSDRSRKKKIYQAKINSKAYQAEFLGNKNIVPIY